MKPFLCFSALCISALVSQTAETELSLKITKPVPTPLEKKADTTWLNIIPKDQPFWVQHSFKLQPMM